MGEARINNRSGCGRGAPFIVEPLKLVFEVDFIRRNETQGGETDLESSMVWADREDLLGGVAG